MKQSTFHIPPAQIIPNEFLIILKTIWQHCFAKISKKITNRKKKKKIYPSIKRIAASDFRENHALETIFPAQTADGKR